MTKIGPEGQSTSRKAETSDKTRQKTAKQAKMTARNNNTEGATEEDREMEREHNALRDRDEEEDELMGKMIKAIRGRGIGALDSEPEKKCEKELKEEASRFWTDNKGNPIFMEQQFGKGVRKDKVRCGTLLTRSPRWRRDAKGEYQTIESCYISVNANECPVRALATATRSQQMNRLMR